MHGYLKGHELRRQGRAGVFWWIVDGGTERYPSLEAAAEAVRAGRIRRAAHVGEARRVQSARDRCRRVRVRAYLRPGIRRPGHEMSARMGM